MTSDQIALVAAIVSIASFAATLIFSIHTKNDVQEQLANARAQLEEAKRQFLAQNEPDVGLDAHVRSNPPDQAGVWLTATNHHASVTINDLQVFLVGDSPTQKEAFTMIFLTFGDLKPMQTIRERSLQSLDKILLEHFPGSGGDALISDTPSLQQSFEYFPLKLHYSYTPRYAGATKVSRTRDLVMGVLRKAAA